MEQWKDCYGYEDCYEVSNLGNVRSKDRQCVSYGTRVYNRKGQVLAQHQGKNGYMYVELCKDGCRTTFNSHRLVALTFLSNPLNLPQVDHIDRDKTNNVITNLRWVSNAENQANRGMQKNNTSGEMYIGILYRVSIIRNGKKTQKAFTSMEEAKQFRMQQLGF